MPKGKKKSGRGKRGGKRSGKGLQALRRYQRFLRAAKNKGMSPSKAKTEWRKIQNAKQKAIASCIRQVRTHAPSATKAAMREVTKGAGMTSAQESVVKEFLKEELAHADDGAVPLEHRAVGHGLGGLGFMSGDPRKRRHKRKKKGGKKSGKRRIAYRVKGKSKWVRYAAPRMKKAMTAISRSYKTGKTTKVALDKRRKAKRYKKTGGKSGLAAWRAFRKAHKGSGLTKKQLRKKFKRQHDWPEKPNLKTSRGKRAAAKHSRVTKKNWKSSRRKKYGKKGFSKKGLAKLARAGRKHSKRSGRRRPR